MTFRESFVGSSLELAWRGKSAIVYPLIYAGVRGCFCVGVALFLAAISEIPAEKLSENAWLISILGGLVVSAWWIFSAVCRLAWWRTFEQSHALATSRGDWLRDLPAMLGVEIAFGLGRISVMIAFLAGVAMMLRGVFGGVWGVAFAATVAIFLEVMQSAITAERIVAGPSMVEAVRRALHQWHRRALRMLALEAMPALAVMAMWGLAFCASLFGNGWMSTIAVVGAGLIPWIEPAFWIEHARRP